MMNRGRSETKGVDKGRARVEPTTDQANPPDLRAEPDAIRLDLEDRLTRALAEQQNIRDHNRRQMQRAVSYAASRLAVDLLETADNLRRAIASMPDGTLADSGLRRLFDGVVATERALASAFTKHGIILIDPLGEPFDPALHEAINMLADDTQPAGTVSAVARPGYLHHGRLLRPAAVHVTTSPGNANKK